MTGDETDRCPNCNVAPEDVEKGHDYTETEDGIAYNVEHLHDLGHLRANGLSLLFDRMHNRLVIERNENDNDTAMTDTDGTDTPPIGTGAKLQVRLIDYERRDDDGNPYCHVASQQFTLLDMARMDERDFIEHAIKLAAQNVLKEYRHTGAEDDE